MLTKGLIKSIGFQGGGHGAGRAGRGAMGEQATVFAPLGTLFIQLIKMLVILLVAVAILSGAANLGASPAAGKIGVTTLAFFLVTSALAVFLALVMGQVFKPGVVLTLAPPRPCSPATTPTGGTARCSGHPVWHDPDQRVQRLERGQHPADPGVLHVPRHRPGQAAPRARKPLVDGLNTLVDAFVWMINKVMLIAPIGVFGLMADAIGTYGFDVLTLVLKLFVVYIAAILIFGFRGLSAADRVLLQHAGTQVLLRDEETADRGLLHRLFHGDPAGQHGDLRARSEGDQRHRVLRAAAGRHHQHERQRHLLRPGRHLLRPGL